jgi:Rrf2 family iron-sulfur cluster assembly transcriptional regulator
MVDLAQHGDNGPVSRQAISERQEISADYVAQLFGYLQTAGLVEGVKGPGGGYRLARDAGRISAADVVQAVEGPLAVVHCALPCPDEGSACNRQNHCVTHLLWKRLSAAMTEVLDSATLDDLVDRAQELAQEKV